MLNYILQFLRIKSKQNIKPISTVRQSKYKPYNPKIGDIIEATDGLLTLKVVAVWNNKARVKVIQVDSFWAPERFRMQNVGTGLVINEEFDMETNSGRTDWFLASSKPWYLCYLNPKGIPVLTHYR